MGVEGTTMLITGGVDAGRLEEISEAGIRAAPVNHEDPTALNRRVPILGQASYEALREQPAI